MVSEWGTLYVAHSQMVSEGDWRACQFLDPALFEAALMIEQARETVPLGTRYKLGPAGRRIRDIRENVKRGGSKGCKKETRESAHRRRERRGPQGRPPAGVRVGNDAMAGAGVGQGDWMALAQNRAPEHGDVVAAQIDGAVEVRRFVHTHARDVLEAEPGNWTSEKPRRVWADAENVTMLGVEIASTVTAEGRKRRERKMERALKRRAEGWNAENERPPGSGRNRKA